MFVSVNSDRAKYRDACTDNCRSVRMGGTSPSHTMRASVATAGVYFGSRKFTISLVISRSWFPVSWFSCFCLHSRSSHLSVGLALLSSHSCCLEAAGVNLVCAACLDTATSLRLPRGSVKRPPRAPRFPLQAQVHRLPPSP